MNQQREQFDSDLTKALAADDVVAALDELSRRYAGDAEAGERIRESRQLVGDLISIGEHLSAEQAPTMPKLNLPARRIRPWWIAVPAAAAVAAAVILAILLQSPPIGPGPAPGPAVLVASRHQTPADTWRVPSVSPISLGSETFTIPSISIPSISTSLPNIGWDVPPVTGDYSNRSNGNET